MSQTGAELLFEVFSQRYERASTIVTSNLPDHRPRTQVCGQTKTAYPIHPWLYFRDVAVLPHLRRGCPCRSVAIVLYNYSREHWQSTVAVVVPIVHLPPLLSTDYQYPDVMTAIH